MFVIRKKFRYPNNEGSLGRAVKIGRQTQKSTAISTANAEAIIVRGRDLCSELIGRIGFTDHMWLLITGDLPSATQRRVLDATLIAIAEHGLVPSVQASRMTLAAAPEALQGAVAAGILGCGSVVLGSSALAGEFFAAIVTRANGGSLEAAARAEIAALRAAGKAIPGYGHPLHRAGDPRAQRLLEVSVEAGASGHHIEAAQIVERLLPETTGKTLVMNVSGAIPAALLDVGYPVRALKGVPIVARTAGLVAHLLEEQLRPLGFVLSHAGARAIDYDGPAPAGFVPSHE